MADTRPIREKLMTYGHNEGRLMTEEEFVSVMATEIESIDTSLLGPILSVIQQKVNQSVSTQIRDVFTTAAQPANA